MAKIKHNFFVALVLVAALMFAQFPFIGVKQAQADDTTTAVSLKVEYPVTSIKCNEPTEFVCKGTGGNGQYIFRLDAIYMTAGGARPGYNSLVDPNKLNYTTTQASSHTFRFRFMASGSYRMTFSIMDKSIQPIQTKRETIYFNVNDARYPSVSTRLNQVISETGITTNMSDYEKALILHDWIIDTMGYAGDIGGFMGFVGKEFLPQPLDEADLYTFVDAEAALCRGYGVCEAYRSGYEALLNSVGIETARMTGDGHAWTAAKLDGSWCQIDTTHDDVEGSTPYFPSRDVLRHLEFGITDEMKHQLTPGHPAAGVAGYKSNSLENNWLFKTGKVQEYSDAFIADVQSNLDAGLTSFNFALNTQHASWPAGYKDPIFSVVAYTLAQHNWNFKVQNSTLEATYADNSLSFSVVPPKPVTPPQQPSNPPSNPSAGPGTPSTPQATSIAMYRLYNPWTLEHFYTASAKERKDCIARGWRDEKIGWYAPTTGKDVYRLYNPWTSDHHYTMSASERSRLVKLGWNYEGVAWKSGGPVPLYRQFNPYETVGTHNYTTSINEHKSLVKMGWHDEGIAWYGVKAAR